MLRPMRAIFSDLSRLFRPKSQSDRAPMAGTPGIAILALLADAEDRSVLAALAARHGWETAAAESLESARRVCARWSPQIVLLDREVAGLEWRGFISELAAASGACVVLVSAVLDDNLWNEVVCNGGYEVLPKPLREEQVGRTVRMARSFWATANRAALMAEKRS